MSMSPTGDLANASGAEPGTRGLAGKSAQAQAGFESSAPGSLRRDFL